MGIKQENIKLAIKSWIAGLFSAGAVFMPFERVLGKVDELSLLSDIFWRVVTFILFIPIGLMGAFTWGIVLSTPLFLIALLFSFIFERTTARYPKTMSALAMLVTATIVASATALARDNQWANSLSFWQKFYHFSLSFETWALYAFPVGVGSFYYCSQLRRRKTYFSGGLR